LQSLIIAAAALVLVACGGEGAAEKAEPAAPLVEVAAAAPASAAGAVRASGVVGYKRETLLSFNAPGIVTALSVDEGDLVRAGQRLAAARRTSVGANADESALARENAERQLARTQALFDQGFVSQAALDDARLAASRARAGSAIVAPAAGIILRRLAEPAQVVDAGQPVLLLGETASGIIVRASVSSDDAVRVSLDDRATVRVADGAAREGRVARIGAKSNDATGAFEIEIALNVADDIRSGQVADVEIAAAAPPEVRAALIVPALSLLDARADQGVVFVVDAQGVARRRTVETAGLMQDHVLVVSGLESGERVVASGVAYVRDGEPVRIASPR